MLIYIVYEQHGMNPMVTTVKAFKDENNAIAYCKELIDKLPLEDKPEYDLWGCTTGLHYGHYQIKLEE